MSGGSRPASPFPRSRTFRRVTPLIAAFAGLVVAAATAEAQTARGVVVQDGTRDAVQEVTIKLLAGSDGDDVLAQMISSDGHFLFRAMEPGVYRIQAERLGYQTVVTPPFYLEEDRERSMTVRIGVQAIPLAPLVVQAGTTPEPWFMKEIRRRAQSGFGRFLLRSDLDTRDPQRLPELLASMSGVRVTFTAAGDPVIQMARATPTIFRIGTSISDLRAEQQTEFLLPEEQYVRMAQCPPALLVNGRPWYSPREEEDPDWLPLETIRQFFNHAAGDLEAIEVYRGSADLPSEYAGIQGANCGVIVAWLRPGGR